MIWSIAATALTAFVSFSEAQVGQSPFLPRSRPPCPCVDSCIYSFDGPELPNFQLPGRGPTNQQLNVGNPIVSGDGSAIQQACTGDDTSYLNDNLEWVSTVTDDNGVQRDIDAFFATGTDSFNARTIPDSVFNGYQNELSGRLLKTVLECNGGDRGCAYFTVNADDFVCPCPIDIQVPLSVDQEMLGGVNLTVPSTGSGTARVQYNPVSRVLSWDIQTQGLSSDLVQLHFHGPASRIMGGPLMVNATNVGNPPLGMTGTIFLAPEQGAALVNGMWYINVHTALNPSGELRGQIQEPDMVVDLSVDQELLGGVVLMTPSQGSGTASIFYDRDTQLLAWDIQPQDLSSPLVQLHLHGPATPIMGGPLMINATNVGVPPFGNVGAATLSDEQATNFEAGTWYINVHTTGNPSGELRGNIRTPGANISCTVEQEIAGGVMVSVPSGGSGVGLLNYNSTSRLLSWDIRVENLSSDLVQLHLHGPANTNEGGPLQINATAVGIPPFGMVGAVTLDAEQAANLELETWYINVHTEANPSGELRGNILALELDEPARGPPAIVAENPDGAGIGGMPPGAIAGIVVAGSGCLIGGGVIAMRRKKKKKMMMEKSKSSPGSSAPPQGGNVADMYAAAPSQDGFNPKQLPVQQEYPQDTFQHPHDTYTAESPEEGAFVALPREDTPQQQPYIPAEVQPQPEQTEQLEEAYHIPAQVQPQPEEAYPEDETYRTAADDTYRTATQGTFRTATQGTYRTATQGTYRTATQGTFRTAPQGTYRTATQGPFRTAPQGTYRTATQGTYRTATQGTFRTAQLQPQQTYNAHQQDTYKYNNDTMYSDEPVRVQPRPPRSVFGQLNRHLTRHAKGSEEV